MAPEVHNGHYSASSDVFSFGLVLYELTIGPNPFSRLGIICPTPSDRFCSLTNLFN